MIVFLLKDLPPLAHMGTGSFLCPAPRDELTPFLLLPLGRAPPEGFLNESVNQTVSLLGSIPMSSVVLMMFVTGFGPQPFLRFNKTSLSWIGLTV